jgi:hypothetical protein
MPVLVRNAVSICNSSSPGLAVSSGMSAILELLLELLIDVIGGLLEFWFGASRIYWTVMLILIGGLIWWELR